MKKKIATVFFDVDRIEKGIDVEQEMESIRLLNNWVPLELGKKILVYDDKVTVEGLSEWEVMQELELYRM